MSLLVALAVPLALAGPAPAGAFPTDAKLPVSDGTTVTAVLGVPPKGATQGVVFVHMAGRSKEDWLPVAEKFYRSGLSVLTVDLRGHGGNVTSETPPALTGADWAAMVEDVKAGVGELKKRGAQKVAIVGAEVGANLALVVASDDPSVVSVAMLSPGLDYKGIPTGEAMKRYGPRPVLFVAGSDDSYSVRSANALESVATGQKSVTVLENAGKGTKMFNRAPTLESQLLGFVTTAWTAAPPTGPTGPVDLTIKSDAIETSGKRIGEDLPPVAPN